MNEKKINKQDISDTPRKSFEYKVTNVTTEEGNRKTLSVFPHKVKWCALDPDVY